MWIKLLLMCVVVIITLENVLCVLPPTHKGILDRRRRFLLFPETTNVIQIIIGIGVPLELKSHSVVFGWGFRAFYTMPANLSEVMPMDSNLRRKRSVSRWDVYKALEKMSDAKGDAGKSCILRSICQAADVPLDKRNGFFEEVFHVLFTPTTTNEEVQHHTDNEYYAAQHLGKKYKGKCQHLFPDCQVTLMDMFTQLLSNQT